MRKNLFIALLILAATCAHGQFYNTGRGPTCEKWMQLKTPSYKLLYPKGYEIPASKMAFMLDTIHPLLNFGIDFKQQRLPIVLRTQNILSNGYVTWAPKREELVMSPSNDNYALTWSKSLAVHEGRHVAQISAMKRGLTKIATWLLGEAGMSLGLLVISDWQLEGDAVLAETQFAEFGRGLQPDFTIGYRAIFAGNGATLKKIDPYVCGSYKNFYPDIYKYGYQLMSAADNRYSPQLWGEILEYSGRWPIFIVPDFFYLRYKYKTSWRRIARDAFAELDSLWEPLHGIEQNYLTLTGENRHSYTTFQYPVSVNNSTLAFKTDFNTPTRFVDIDTKKQWAQVGNITSRPAVENSKIYWTEYRPHPIFEQVTYSSIRELDLATGKKRNILPYGRNFMVTPIDSGFATVSIDKLSNNFIRFFDADFNNIDTYRFPYGYEIALQGLAWDDSTKALYYIAIDNDGMYIGSTAKDKNGKYIASKITKPSRVTISDISAHNGNLYFSSIESGKNEIHSINLATGVEHRLTDSRFGAISPAASDSAMLFTSYTKGGYMVSRGSIDTVGRPTVAWSKLPQNIVNPYRKSWGVPKVDSIDGALPVGEMKSTPFNKAAHLFNVHSWAPIGFDGDYIFDRQTIQAAFGATAFFQSTLGDLDGYATYGWLNSRNWLKGRFNYKGLPLTISLRAEYGGGEQIIYGSTNSTPKVHSDLYFSTSLSFALPLNLSSNGYSRLFQPSFAVQYSNSLIWGGDKYNLGIGRYDGSLWYSSTRYTAHRTLTPRLGYAVKASVSGSFNKDFGTLYSIYGRGYLPGVAKNHSITLQAAYQYQEQAKYMFGSKTMVPRGVHDPYATKNYAALNITYAAPIFYPDWGIDGILFFKRVTIAAFGGFSAGQYFLQTGIVNRQNYSYGADLGIDFSIFQAFEQNLTFTFAFPSTSSSMFFGVAYNFGF